MRKRGTKPMSGPDLTRFPDCDAMRELVRTGAKGSTRDDLNRAQELAYDACQEPTPARRNALARKALAHSPLCADAWLELSNLRNLTAETRREYLARAVYAGRLAIGEHRFDEDKGDFWLILETRPYMRARHALAEDLWFSGLHDEAIGHLREMLELNPNDNQGLRHILLTWLMWTGDDEAARSLLKEHHEEISTFLEFTRALLAFKAKGDSEAARQAAAHAILANRHVGRFLAHPKSCCAMSDFYSPGQENEAAWYAQELGGAWLRAPGSIEWLARQVVKEPVQNRDGDTLH